jgi:hypothetical protein
MGNTVSSPNSQSTIFDRQTLPRNEKNKLVPKLVPSTINGHSQRNNNNNNNGGNPENSRVLFLLYLINRTWNVVVDGKKR